MSQYIEELLQEVCRLIMLGVHSHVGARDAFDVPFLECPVFNVCVFDVVFVFVDTIFVFFIFAKLLDTLVPLSRGYEFQVIWYVRVATVQSERVCRVRITMRVAVGVRMRVSVRVRV